jgi:hypothetical protein
VTSTMTRSSKLRSAHRPLPRLPKTRSTH